MRCYYTVNRHPTPLVFQLRDLEEEKEKTEQSLDRNRSESLLDFCYWFIAHHIGLWWGGYKFVQSRTMVPQASSVEI